MPIKVRCGACEATLNVSDKAAGKVVLCKSCGGRIKVPALAGDAAAKTPAAGEKPVRRRPPATAENAPADHDDLFGGLDLDRAEDVKRKVCPGCAAPVRAEDIECPKCGVNIQTGTLSERQRKMRSRKGPPPEEFYGAVWGNAWKFLKAHKGFAVLTAVVWTTTLSMAFTCLFAHGWYIRTRTADLLESAKADPAVSIEGDVLYIRIPKDGKARYDGKLYTTPGATITLPAPRLAAMREPPALFWMGMCIVFQLGFGGWAWMLAVKIAELTLSGGKKIKRFQTDFFGNLTMGFRFYFWPVVLMLPVIWIGPLVAGMTKNPAVGGAISGIILLMPMLLFLPAAVIHMTQRYGYRAWLINWMVKDFFNTMGPSLYIAGMMFVLVLLVPFGVAGAMFATREQLLPWVMEREAQALAWLATIQDMGDGSIRFLFYQMPLVFMTMFTFYGVICGLMAFPAVFMMRVIGLYGVYFKPELSLVSEFPDKTPAGFGPRFLAYLVDSIIIAILQIPASFIGWASGLLFYFYGWDNIGAILSQVVQAVAGLGLVGFYFASGESGQARATMGKWSLGLMVLREDDMPMTRKQAFGRAASALVTALTLYIGFVMCAFRKDHRALHDLMSKSKVVWRGEEIS